MSIAQGALWLRRLFGRRAEAVAQAYRRSFDPATPDGRALLQDLATYCHVGAPTFVPGDPYASAHAEGRRDVYLHIVQLAELDPADFPKLVRVNDDE